MFGGAWDWLTADVTLLGLPLAFVLGALVGLEREWRRNAAGLRPCVLVCTTAAAFADLVVVRVDPGNLGAGFGAIATGVGFLGAGAIMKDGASIRGLSTAATLWCLAAIGANAGAGEEVAAIWLTLLVLAVNIVLKPAARVVRRRRPPRSEDEGLMEG
ncbi:MgtC/SapB family protein [Belnapia rosea]|uniref:Protein MgtC n=1 Tax=Belnapia rosea TaxID=938405 RepID=A0A1G6VK41_9PROT|nr:MgtC/SapB family protein [Belnapia rosea]SDD53918.1 putative Mg2+ transporter-C (MgtC) family protein [Belnapia rosea]